MAQRRATVIGMTSTESTPAPHVFAETGHGDRCFTRRTRAGKADRKCTGGEYGRDTTGISGRIWKKTIETTTRGRIDPAQRTVREMKLRMRFEARK